MFLDIHRSQTNSVGFGVSSSRQSRKRTPKPDFHSNKDHKRFVTVFESVLSSTPDTPPMHSVTSSRHYIIMHRRRHISYIKVTCFESSLSFAGIAMGRSIGEEETFNCGVDPIALMKQQEPSTWAIHAWFCVAALSFHFSLSPPTFFATPNETHLLGRLLHGSRVLLCDAVR